MMEFLEKVFLVLGNMQKGLSILFLDIVIHEGQTAENRLRKQTNSKWRAVPREAEWSWNLWLYQFWNVCFLWTSRYEKLSSYLI